MEKTNNDSGERFIIDNKETAAWAFRRLAEVNAAIEENESFANAEIERVKEWLEAENGSLVRDREFFEHLLIDYTKREKETNPKAKVSTPWGSVKTRTARKYVWMDDDVMEWAKTSGAQYIKEKVSLSLDKAALKKDCKVTDEGDLVDANGEIVPGVKAPYETTYTVDVKE